MDAATMMTALTNRLDAQAWDELADLLDDAFTCHYVHTGETFDKYGWVRVNAEYPGFEHLVLRDCVASVDRAAGRCHVTGRGADGVLQRFEVATFITVSAGLITKMTEVWTDVDLSAPEGTRPQ